MFISEAILLDESPPELYNITIETGGSLVADPATKVALRVANIYIEGALEIGSEDCLFDGDLTITLTGITIKTRDLFKTMFSSWIENDDKVFELRHAKTW